ncbi:MAG: GNAT family N-acetyltransferase [bacterium]|nr:GNAT family N-acetyltransferase [bacterium]
MDERVNVETLDVRNNVEGKRFEVVLGDEVAMVQYYRDGDIIAYTHTEVPTGYEGQGIAEKMVKVALDYARENQLMVAPFCPFVAAYVKRHPEYQDITIDLNSLR